MKFPKGWSSVMVNGLVMFLPYWAFLTSLRDESNIEPCSKDNWCDYARYFPLIAWQELRDIHVCPMWDNNGADSPFGQCLPHRLFRHVYVRNGQGQWWLDQAGVSPKCGNMTEDHCTTDLLSDPVKNMVYRQFSSVVYQVSVSIWAITRVVHDLLLLAGMPFNVTMAVSHFSTVALVWAAAASVIMTWNALELLPALNPHGHPNCACWFRLGFLTSVSAITSPVALTFHLFYKLEDSYRAYVGGDYLITKRYHVAFHMVQGVKGLNPMTSVLGVPVLGVPGGQKDSRRTSSRKGLVPREALCGHSLNHCFGRSVVSWLAIVGVITVASCWCLALPTIALRGTSLSLGLLNTFLPPDEHLGHKYLFYKTKNGLMMGHNEKWIFVVFLLLLFSICFGFAGALIFPGRTTMIRRILPTTMPLLAFISDKHAWDLKDPSALQEALERCPEILDCLQDEKNRIHKGLDLNFDEGHFLDEAVDKTLEKLSSGSSDGCRAREVLSEKSSCLLDGV